MMSGNSYNCFVAGLPDIFWDDRKLSVSVHAFREEARDYIGGRDESLLNLFFLPHDHAQILRLLNKQEPDMALQTVYPLKQLEEEVIEPDDILPSYLRGFICDFKDEHLKFDLAPENVLSWMYYDHMMGVENKLVCGYAAFFMNLKNLVTALNCRKYGRNLSVEIIGSNDFAEALRTVGSKDFGLGMEYPYVDKVITLMEGNNLVDRERGLDLLVWDFLDEAVVFEYFSIEKVISFMLKLMIVERWSKMSSESGREVFMEMVGKFKTSFQFEG